MEDKKITLRIYEELYQKLKNESKIKYCSINELIILKILNIEENFKAYLHSKF